MKDIETRIHQAIQPVLDKADVLIESYMPDKYRVIGKHHPEYDTLGGQLHYLNRKTRELSRRVTSQMGAAYARSHPRLHP